MELILSKNWGAPNRSAYASLQKLFKMTPAQVIEEVKASGLRGRGGAGFSAGVKWGFIPKDRAIAEKDPHMMIEGMIIAAYAIGAHTAYIYIRGEFYKQWEIVEAALKEAAAKGFLGKNILGSKFDLDIYQHRGAGAYICGEETALLSSLEGGRGYL